LNQAPRNQAGPRPLTQHLLASFHYVHSLVPWISIPRDNALV